MAQQDLIIVDDLQADLRERAVWEYDYFRSIGPQQFQLALYALQTNKAIYRINTKPKLTPLAHNCSMICQHWKQIKAYYDLILPSVSSSIDSTIKNISFSEIS